MIISALLIRCLKIICSMHRSAMTCALVWKQVFAYGRGWNDSHLDTTGTTLPYCSFFPKDGMLLARGGVTVSSHLPALVYGNGKAISPVERSQVGHCALLP